MAADIIFVIMLPQLVCVLFFSFSNTYGAFAGFFTGLVLRIGAGESYLSLPCLSALVIVTLIALDQKLKICCQGKFNSILPFFWCNPKIKGLDL